MRDEIKAEKLLVFRPGIVVGHSETGVIDKIDGPYYFFKLLQRLRYALPQWFPLAGPEGGQTNIVPVDFVAKAMDHIAHMDDADLPGETFHLVNPEPMTVGEAMIEFAKAAHAPQMAMRIDPKVPKAIPKTVRAGFKQVPIVKRVRAQVLRDLGVPPAVLETRDFRCTFDARDTQRALTGTGIACPPLSTYAPRLWDYWERNLDPDLFRDRTLSHAIEGKRILITGASSGIGRTTALKLGEAGGEVILVARTREKLEEVAREIEEAGGKAHVHTADLTDLDDLDRLTKEVIEAHGGVDILVNNAGRSIRRSVHYQYDRFHDFERTMQLNYFASLKLILAFAPGMRAAQERPHHQHLELQRADEHAAVRGVRRVEGGARPVLARARRRGGPRRAPHHDDLHVARAHADDRADRDLPALPRARAGGGGAEDHRRDHRQAQAGRDAPRDRRRRSSTRCGRRPPTRSRTASTSCSPRRTRRRRSSSASGPRS